MSERDFSLSCDACVWHIPNMLCVMLGVYGSYVHMYYVYWDNIHDIT